MADVGSLAMIGASALATYPPALIIAGFIMILLPGLMLLMSGFLARENTRASAANAIVLEAAARLLLPVEENSREAEFYADKVRASALGVDKAMGHALSSMKAMSGELGDERLRLESVSYTTADNARDLSERMEGERRMLEKLASELREQTDELTEVLPRQAKEMAEQAKAAGDEIRAADQVLEARLGSLDASQKHLTEKIYTMDELAEDAAKRNEALVFAISRMEEKLEQSRKTVDTAVRAGEMAAAAAGTTGDRLSEAVSGSLDQARKATREITDRSRDAADNAAKALNDLKAAGEEAAAAVRAAGIAARAEMDITERRAVRIGDHLHKAGQTVAEASRPKPVVPVVETPVEPEIVVEPEARHEEPVPEEMPKPEIKKVESKTSETKKAEPARKGDKSGGSGESAETLEAPARSVDDDLFEASADRMARTLMGETQGQTDFETVETHDGLPKGLFGMVEEDETGPTTHYDFAIDGPTRSFVRPAAAPASSNGTTKPDPEAHKWSAIIADMRREDGEDEPEQASTPEPDIMIAREEVAVVVMAQLVEAGIHLGEVFRPRDKKKIALAATKGDVERREVVLSSAARHIAKIRKRLDGDEHLTSMAEDFLAHEQTDALNALDRTSNTAKHATPRLAAFLLIDAALS